MSPASLEEARIGDLMRLVPNGLTSVLDAGARDGLLSLQLAERVKQVTALDLVKPPVEHPCVTPVQGDLRALPYPDGSFDLVLCSEVLEHIDPGDLSQACSELIRVSRRYLLVGVPYREDTRVGRTTCASCGATNPPWGHINSFDETRLDALFPALHIAERSLVGMNRRSTNQLSAALYAWARHPWGTYSQREACIVCGAKLVAPSQRSVVSKVYSRLAYTVEQVQRRVSAPYPNWIHTLYDKQ